MSIVKHVIVPFTVTEIIKDLSASPFYGKPQVQVITMQKNFILVRLLRAKTFPNETSET